MTNRSSLCLALTFAYSCGVKSFFTTTSRNVVQLQGRQRAVRRLMQQCALYSSANALEKEGNHDKDPLQEALQRAEERALDHFIETQAPSWINQNGRQTLPFQCTACGRCCQTEGDVYLSPEEIQKAAKFLKQTPQDFVQIYASHVLGPTTDTYDETTTWIRLREQDGSCIFLGPDGKSCSIYEARPVQCSTYPFWPNIVQSKQSWDEECRRTDDDVDNPLAPWTPSDGGCEGMQTMDTAIGGNDDEQGVPVREAYRQLYEYIISDKRFPKGTERPLAPSNGSK